MIEHRPPRVSWDAVPFWDGCDREELLVERCTSCGTVNWFPRRFCVACGSDVVEWTPATGHGTIESFSHVHRPINESYADEVPYVLALVRIDEGPMFVTRIVGDDAFAATIGDDVVVRFLATTGAKLPVFTLAR